jgi:sugar lactone lactonase YvrE
MASRDVDVVIDASEILGEGPVWVDDSLWWVDIEGHRIHRTDPDTGQDRVIQLDDPIGSVIPRATGGWVAGVTDGVAIIASDGTEERRIPIESADLATAAVEHRQPLIEVGAEKGLPDGMTVDADGCMWVAFWGGSCVRRYDPIGHLMRVVELPVSLVTSCTFGGKDLDQLFITTASVGLNDSERAAQPLAGAVFRVDPGVRGTPASYFAA